MTKRTRIAVLRKQSKVPKDYTDASLDEFRTGKHAAAAQRLRFESPETIILCGANTYRNGKSHLMGAAVNYSNDQCKPAFYCWLTDFFTAVRSTFSAAATRTAEQVMAQFMAYELLALDEFQVRSDSEFENLMFRRLIDWRHSEHLRTVLGGNLAMASIPQYIDAASYMRIVERGGAIECNWSKPSSILPKKGLLPC